MKISISPRLSRLLPLFVAFTLCIPALSQELKWEKHGNEAVIVYKDGKEKKIIGSGYDPKFKSPGPFKHGFMWWADLKLSNYTWAKHADPQVAHPVHLVHIQSGNVVDCDFQGLNAYDDVVYLFDDRGQLSADNIGDIYFKVWRDHKCGLVKIGGGKVYEIIPPQYNYVLPQLYIPVRYAARYYSQRRGEGRGWIAIENDRHTFYDNHGNILVSPTTRSLYSGSFFVKDGYKLKLDHKVHAIGLDDKKNDYPAYGCTPFFGALATAPLGRGAGGTLFNDGEWDSPVWHLRQPVLFLHSDDNVAVCMAGPRDRSVIIPHIRWLHELKDGETHPNFRFGEDPDGSYMAISPDEFGRIRDMAGFVDFGEKPVYLPPVFRADWTAREVRPERFRSLPSDTTSVYYVRNERDNRPGMIHRLYSASAGKFIWDTPDHAVMGTNTGSDGFIDIALNNRTDSVVRGFITARADSIVIPASMVDLAAMGQVKAIVGGNRIFTFGGGVGLSNEGAGQYIAPVYDDITPMRTVAQAAPADWFLTRRGNRYGLMRDGTTVLQCVYDRVEAEGDSLVTFSLTSWPRKGYKYHDGRLNTIQLSPRPYFVYLRTDSVGVVSDNFDSLLQSFANNGNEDVIKASYCSMLDMMVFSSRSDLFYPLTLTCAAAMEDLVGKKISADNYVPDTATDRGVKFAEELYNMLGMKEDADRCAMLARDVDAARMAFDQRINEQIEERRRQRAEAWVQLAQALGQLAQGINNSVSQYRASKSSASRSVAAQPRTGAQRTSASSPSGKGATKRGVTVSAPPRRTDWTSLSHTYDNWASSIIKMQVWPDKYYNKNDLRHAQQEMRDIRKMIEARGGYKSKSDLEDWQP